MISSSGTFSSPITATFLNVPVAFSFTCTSISNIVSVSGLTFTSSHVSLFPSCLLASGVVFIIVNSLGTSSSTSTFPDTFPAFVNLIWYLNLSPGFTVFSVPSSLLSIVFVFTADISIVSFSSFGFTSGLVFLSFPIVATFIILPEILLSFIVNLTSTFPFAGTDIPFKPFINSFASMLSSIASLFSYTCILPITSAFPSDKISSNLASFIVVSPSASPVFSTEIT